MPEYKFYKLIKNNDCFYVGVTKYILCNRKANHKESFNKWKRGEGRPHYYFTDDFSFDGVKIELIEKGEYPDLSSTRQRENELMDLYSKPEQPRNKILNPNYQKEYREEHKEELKEQKAKYYQENKETLNEKNKQYVEEHRDEIKKYKAKWNKDHPPTEEQKQKAKEKRSEIVECDICGEKVSKGSLKKHKDRWHTGKKTEIEFDPKKHYICELCNTRQSIGHRSRHTKLCKTKHPIESDSELESDDENEIDTTYIL